MATFNFTEEAAGGLKDGAVNCGNVVRKQRTLVLAGQANGDVGVVMTKPRGFRFAYGVVTTDTSLGTAQIAFGTAGSAAKFKAAGTLTAVDTPTLFGKQAAVAEAEADAEQVQMTVSAAALPGAGNLVVDFYFSKIQ